MLPLLLDVGDAAQVGIALVVVLLLLLRRCRLSAIVDFGATRLLLNDGGLLRLADLLLLFRRARGGCGDLQGRGRSLLLRSTGCRRMLWLIATPHQLLL